MKVGDLVKYKYDIVIPDYIDHINQRTVEQVLKDGAIEITKQYSTEEHAYLIDLIDKSGKLYKELSEEGTLALASYFSTLDPWRAAELWTAVGNGTIKNAALLHRLVFKRLVEILTALLPTWEERDTYKGQTGVIISNVNPVDDEEEKNWYQIYWANETITNVLGAWMEIVSESR